jgi:hypothetical protein
MSLSQKVVAGLGVKVLGCAQALLQIIEFFLLGPTPHKFLLTTTPDYLAEGPCNMGESQQEPVVEIGKDQKALKLSECGWGWPVMDDLDLGWIHMYSMLINDVDQVMDPVHAKGAFFQVGI